MSETAVQGWAFGRICFLGALLGLITLFSTHPAFNTLNTFNRFAMGVDVLFFVWIFRKQSPLTLDDKRYVSQVFTCCVILGAILRVGGVWLWLAGQWVSGPGYSQARFF